MQLQLFLGSVLMGLVLFIDGLDEVLRWLGGSAPTMAVLAGVSIAVFALHPLSAQKLSRALRACVPRSWLVFLGVLLLSLVWTQNTQYGALKVLAVAVVGLVPGVACALAFHRTSGPNWHVISMMGLIYLGLLFIGALATDASFGSRLSLPGGNPIWAARAALVTVTVGLFYHHQGKHFRRGLLIILGAGAALLTGARGPLVAAAVGIIIGGFVALRRSGRRGTKTALAGALAVSILLGIAFLTTPLGGYSITEPTGGTMPESQIGFSRVVGLVSPGRLQADPDIIAREVWGESALQHFRETPWQGLGLGGFSPEGVRRYPHNIALELLAETGLPGLIALIIGLGAAAMGARNDPLFMAILVQTVVAAMSSGDLVANATVFFVGTLLAARVRYQRWSTKHNASCFPT